MSGLKPEQAPTHACDQFVMPRRRSRRGVARPQRCEECITVVDAQECALASAAEHQGPGVVRLPLGEDRGGERGVALEVVEGVGGVDQPGDSDVGVVLRESGSVLSGLCRSDKKRRTWRFCPTAGRLTMGLMPTEERYAASPMPDSNTEQRKERG